MKSLNERNIGFLHPGKMGISLAATAQNSGFEACWVSSDRSESTRQRASKAALREFSSIDELCQQCPVVVSICPPQFARDVADQVLNSHFKGIFVEANAISPELSQKLGERFTRNNSRYVDACVIGAPAWKQNATWMHLCGPASDIITKYFVNGPLQTNIIDDVIGKASALKMCFAARSKGTIALLLAITAAADKLGIRSELEWQWDQYQAGFSENTHSSMIQSSEKAWRFASEMDEIASTLASTGIPQEFHLAAADIYRRMEKFKNQEQAPGIHQIIDALLNP